MDVCVSPQTPPGTSDPQAELPENGLRGVGVPPRLCSGSTVTPPCQSSVGTQEFSSVVTAHPPHCSAMISFVIQDKSSSKRLEILCWTKDRNRHSTKEGLQMATDHVERRCVAHHPGDVHQKRSQTPPHPRGRRVLVQTGEGCACRWAASGKGGGSSPSFLQISRGSSAILSRPTSRSESSNLKRELLTRVHSNTVPVAGTWRQPECPSVGEGQTR